jgi:two-component system, OmpR family, alkaline phosphatase synthesis response regulator PhoP
VLSALSSRKVVFFAVKNKPPTRILVVEDDLSILTGLSMTLTFEGFEVIQAQDGKSGLQKAIDDEPELIVLDVMLPQLNGFELLKELRNRGRKTPVVLLSAKGTEPDKILGLNLGADDYVVKPFGIQELLARIRAVLRRNLVSEVAQVEFDDVTIDLDAKVARKSGLALELTAQEFKILAHLVTNPGRTFSREDLLSAAWGYDYEGTARTVDNFISQLRAKCERDPAQPRFFKTVRGLGYRFDFDGSATS